MSNIKLYTFNLAVQDTTIITATSENLLFPVSNIKDPRTSKVSRSVTGVLSNEYVFDMITASDVDTVIVVPDNIRGFAGVSGDITVKANIIDGSWGSAPFSTTITPNDDFQLGFSNFTTETYRFWQISFSNTSGFAELSKIFIGASLALPDNNIDFGWTVIHSDNSQFRTNRYRQKFIDIINQQDRYRMNLNLLSKTEFETIKDGFDEVGKRIPLWMILDKDALIVDDAERFAGYFTMDRMPTFTNRAFQLYDMSFVLRQAT